MAVLLIAAGLGGPMLPLPSALIIGAAFASVGVVWDGFSDEEDDPTPSSTPTPTTASRPATVTPTKR